MRTLARQLLLGASSLRLIACVATQPLVREPGLSPEAQISKWMRQRGVVGLAVARLEEGKVEQMLTLGLRSREDVEPLGADTVLYTASLTKLAFAWMVLQLVE